jgi:hypothetical protein
MSPSPCKRARACLLASPSVRALCVAARFATNKYDSYALSALERIFGDQAAKAVFSTFLAGARA